MITNFGHGHVHPALALCRELVKRGHRVTYPSIPRYARQIHAAGAEPLDLVPPKLELSGQFMENLPESQWLIMATTTAWPYFLLDAATTVPQLMASYKNDPPDLVIYDRFAFAGRILATLLGCPAAQTYPHFAFDKRGIYWKNGACTNPEAVVNFGRSLDLFLSTYGIEDGGNLWHVESLNIYFLPKEFQYQVELFDERSRFVGPCLGRPFEPTWKNRANGRPIVLVSDMSSRLDVDYFKTFVGALSGLNCHVILSLGERISRRDLTQLPPNFEINQYASHIEILPHASLSVGRPGMGSTMEALYYGVPVIALPNYPAHEEVAFRLTELGLGLTLPDRTSKTVIRETVDGALRDTALRDRAMSMREVLRRCGGAPVAADCIEKLLDATY